jgi:hypothetical protein
MDSALLVKTLNTGINNAGTGGFLQYSETLQKKDGKWYFKNRPVTSKDNFTVAIAQYMIKTGGDNFGFLKNMPTLPTESLVDVRQAVIKYLSQKK